MPNNDYNIIKPVEGLHNITGLAAPRRREERKRRRELHKAKKQEHKQEKKGAASGNSLSPEVTEEENDRHSIDYCA